MLLSHKVLVAVLLCVAACTKSGADEPGQGACGALHLSGRIRQPRIIDGTQCDVTGSPVAEITLLYASGAMGICSGTAITARHVLTAAHCFEDGDDRLTHYSVMVEGSEVAALKVAVHPRATIPQNDVAVITLKEELHVPAVPILTSRPILTGDIISIFGYGLDEDGNFGALRSGEMEVTGVTSQDIFASFSEGEGSNVCFGDSGGPAIFSFDGEPAIVGVTSFGTQESCATTGVSAFANIQSRTLLDFILQEADGVALL